MKKIILIMCAFVIATGAFAQSEKYMKAMEQQLAGYDTVRNSESLQALANSFERIADAEKTQWLPYYYAALSNVNLGYNYVFGAGPMGGNADKGDPLADKAELLLNKAEALSKDNSEIFVVRKMIATLRMMGDVMNRYMTQGPVAAEALAMAKKLNPDNPRIFMLEGIDQYNTPEQFGGSKTEAKRILEEALKKYESYKPETPIHPTWGLQTTQYFLSLASK
jgi:hypothetical protein